MSSPLQEASKQRPNRWLQIQTGDWNWNFLFSTKRWGFYNLQDQMSLTVNTHCDYLSLKASYEPGTVLNAWVEFFHLPSHNGNTGLSLSLSHGMMSEYLQMREPRLRVAEHRDRTAPRGQAGSGLRPGPGRRGSNWIIQEAHGSPTWNHPSSPSNCFSRFAHKDRRHWGLAKTEFEGRVGLFKVKVSVLRPWGNSGSVGHRGFVSWKRHSREGKF